MDQREHGTQDTQSDGTPQTGGGGGRPRRRRRQKKAPAKKAAAPRAKRTKEKVIARKRLVWVVFNGSMKEEGRFPYDQRAAAEEKIEQLKLKSTKKLYFIQPVKEVIGDVKAAAAVAAVPAEVAPKPARKKPAKVKTDEAEESDEDVEEEEDEDEDDE